MSICRKSICACRGILIREVSGPFLTQGGPSARRSDHRRQTGCRHRTPRLPCAHASLRKYRQCPSSRPCRGEVSGSIGQLNALFGFSSLHSPLAPTYPRPSRTPELKASFDLETLAWTLWNPSRFTVFTRDPIDTTAAQRCPPVPPRYWKDVVCVAGGLGGWGVYRGGGANGRSKSPLEGTSRGG